MTRIAYFNGTFVPETQVMIPYRDRSFNRGDGCFDMTRTFDGRIFRIEEHVERLYRSLRYLRIDIGLEPKEVVAISEEVVQRNEALRAAAGDWWVAQRVSRGVDAIGDEGWAHTGPQLIVDCTPLPLKARAAQFRDGIDVVIPSVRRIPPPMLSPRAKTHNYLNLILADKLICRTMVVMVAWGLMNHVSPMRAARWMALSLLAATQIGGCGRCTGRQVRLTSFKVHTSLSTLTVSSVHSRLTISRHDSKRRTRWPSGTLKASNSTSR